MNKKNTQKLLTKYPQLYRQHSLPMTKTCMCWGFSCGDGWYKILNKMSKELSNYAKKKEISIEAVQVKEKFGLLCVYINNNDDITEKIIEEAENESAKTCEKCGSTEGVSQTKGWISTLCKACKTKKGLH